MAHRATGGPALAVVTTQPLGSATAAVLAAVTASDCHSHGRDLSSTEGTEGSPEASPPTRHFLSFANGKHGLAAAPEGVAFSPSATAYPGGRRRPRRPPCQRGLWQRCGSGSGQIPHPGPQGGPAPADQTPGSTPFPHDLHQHGRRRAPPTPASHGPSLAAQVRLLLRGQATDLRGARLPVPRHGGRAARWVRARCGRRHRCGRWSRHAARPAREAGWPARVRARIPFDAGSTRANQCRRRA